MNVIIIGAARSGTNMLRDILVKFDDFATWPCDEINYIWRYGLKSAEDDEFLPSQVTDKKRRYLNRKFEWVRKKYNVKHVVEKTCANSLRVDYVDAIVNNAKYIFIFRDPVDVVSSAEIRWKAGLDLGYIMAKARFVPVSDVPYYASNYLLNRVNKLISKEKRLSYWGPRYRGFEKDALRMSALEISAIQWKKSVELSAKSFLHMDPEKYIAVDYNRFVEDPSEQLTKIMEFLGYGLVEQEVYEQVKKVSDRSVGKGYRELSTEELEVVHSIVGNQYEVLKNTFLKN